MEYGYLARWVPSSFLFVCGMGLFLSDFFFLFFFSEIHHWRGGGGGRGGWAGFYFFINSTTFFFSLSICHLCAHFKQRGAWRVARAKLLLFFFFLGSVGGGGVFG